MHVPIPAFGSSTPIGFSCLKANVSKGAVRVDESEKAPLAVDWRTGHLEDDDQVSSCAAVNQEPT